jgi:diadenosine tetraphosphate (Ap4A) HIT family hydrolase
MSRGERRTQPPLPDFVGWQTFPFVGEFRVKPLEPPVEEEPPRQGERGDNCAKCAAPDSEYIWVDERWRVRALSRPSGLPAVVVLETRHHYDLGDLSNLLAAELGVLTVRLERGIRLISGVARVHVNRWGDGSEHLHVFFLARPKGMLQLRGTFLSMWDDILPPIPESRWRENLAFIAAWLADYSGEAVAEPPPLDWEDVAEPQPDPLDTEDDGEARSSAGESGAGVGFGSYETYDRPKSSSDDDTPEDPGPDTSPGIIRAVGVASVTSIGGTEGTDPSLRDDDGFSRRRRLQERLEATQRLRSH